MNPVVILTNVICMMESIDIWKIYMIEWTSIFQVMNFGLYEIMSKIDPQVLMEQSGELTDGFRPHCL